VPALGPAGFAALMAPLGPFAAPPFLAIGCSGGPDSLALTLLADEWARARGGRVLALVAEHGLRAESAAEAAAVVAWLAARGIGARVLPLHLTPGPRLQDRARTARRDALLEACREAGALHLLLGHHAEDQGETVIFRALRGSRARGLAGMAPLVVAAKALILRPVIGVPRDCLHAALRRFGAVPLHDPSNADPRFARTRLRGAALPALDPAPFAARRAREAGAEAELLSAAVQLRPQGCARIDLPALGRDAGAARLLAALLRAVGGAPHRPPVAAAARLLAAGQGSLGGCVLRRDGWLLREAAGAPVPATAGALWDGRFRLRRAVPGHVVAALGADAARFRGRHRDLPALALRNLPCLRTERDGMLAAVPHLSYPEAMAELLAFSPRSGPVSESPGWFQSGGESLCS
jgi:tRNA(Ile)-lysidine synthase